MTDADDYSQTLFLPKTDFPMRGGLPQKEPEILAKWAADDIYGALRKQAEGRPKFVLHDGPPYANGHIHIGTALNKTLKDLVVRSQQMLGKDSNYVPGWDCHGLPIEWKVEEENYRSKGKPKPDFRDPAAMIAFRQECRAYAGHWLNVQREEFKRLGGFGDWDHPYSTMSFAAEAQIAREIHKYAANGLLYRGSKPVMWSVVEQTALAEAEVEYEDYVSDTVWVTFPIKTARRIVIGSEEAISEIEEPALSYAIVNDGSEIEFERRKKLLESAKVVIWTTTPWTIPGNRAISYSRKISYGLYEVVAASDAVRTTSRSSDIHLHDRLVIADSFAASIFDEANVRAERLFKVHPQMLSEMICAHPLATRGYTFDVPLLDGDHVTDDAGTGFVHTAPSHGREDFEIWMRRAACSPSAALTRVSPTPSTKTASSPTTRRALQASAFSPRRARRATPTRRSSAP